MEVIISYSHFYFAGVGQSYDCPLICLLTKQDRLCAEARNSFIFSLPKIVDIVELRIGKNYIDFTLFEVRKYRQDVLYDKNFIIYILFVIFRMNLFNTK